MNVLLYKVLYGNVLGKCKEGACIIHRPVRVPAGVVFNSCSLPRGSTTQSTGWHWFINVQWALLYDELSLSRATLHSQI